MKTLSLRLFPIVFLMLSSFCCGPVYPNHINKHDQYALIYHGISTCAGCPETLAEIAEMAHLRVKYVSNPNDIPNLLNHAAIFIIGGTEDNIEPMRKAFNKHVVASIKNYLHNGGNYLGICGGGFIASKYYYAEENLRVNGFDIIPATATDYSKTNKPHLEVIEWGNERVRLYFQGGPAFVLTNHPTNTYVIARYQNGDIAALKHTYGKGTVIVIGPHPEADKTWLEEDHIDASHWHPRQDLLLELIQSQTLRTPG